MAKIGVLLIHGMGSQEEGFGSGMISRLRQKLGARKGDVEFEQIWWAPVLLGRQEQLMRAMRAAGELEWIRLRQFVVEALADAIAYQKTFQTRNQDDELPVYDAVHQIIGRSVHALAARVPRNAPLVVIAHSLGCHMISNYIWDVQKYGPEYSFVVDRQNPFEWFTTLTSITTFGCNMPLFLLASNTLSPIRFPVDVTSAFPGQPASAIADVTRWRNFYDPDDVLGWPLQAVPGYETRVQDKAVNAGGLLTMWNPASHMAYWKDDDVIDPIAKNLAAILRLL